MCHVRQQNLETLGDECAPCNRAARRKRTNGRTLLQTVGKTQHNTKRASARAHKEQNRNCVTFVNKIQKILETSAHLAIGPQGASARRGERCSKLLGKHNTITKRASARAHHEQNRNCVTFVTKIQKLLETSAHLTIGPQGASARRSERCSKLLGKRNTNTKRASARAHKEQHRNCVTFVNKI